MIILTVSPAKLLCNADHPVLHVTYTIKVSNDVEIPIIDTDFDICDNVLDVTPPLCCPLPSTYSGYWKSGLDSNNVISKTFHTVYVSLFFIVIGLIL